MTLEAAREKLKKEDQEHILKFYDELKDEEKEELLDQIEKTDLSILKNYKTAGENKKRGAFSPLPALTLKEIEKDKKRYKEEGLKKIREGKTAALLLAGGMGTRLGNSHPKGTFDIGINKHVYIFERIIKNLLDTVLLSGTKIRLFIMTSEKNHDETVTFFEKNDYFGYDKSYVYFFKQEMAPSCDKNGKAYLEKKNRIATSPNGNAGWYKSLISAGLDKVIEDEGIEWINVFAVDNVLQRILDPEFLGATILNKKAVGAKVVKKASPDEKVGVICLEDNRPSIVEYYELSKEMMDEKDENGESAYLYGVILNYLFKTEELKRIVNNDMENHVVEKKIEYIDENGELIKPSEPNGYKFEQLVLDMIHMMPSCLPYEVIREKEFAPIKNRTGIDSVESARQLLTKNGVLL